MIDDPAGVMKNVQAVTGETDCYGKQAQELGNITFDSKTGFSGTLNKVTGYEGFNSDPSEQTGYFLPFTINDDGVTMYVKNSPVACDKAPTVNVVFLGADKETAEAATLKLTKGGETTTIPMTGITFNEVAAASVKRSRKKVSE